MKFLGDYMFCSYIQVLISRWKFYLSLSMPLYCPCFVSAVMPVQHAMWLTTESLIGIASCILTQGRCSHYAPAVQFFDCSLRFLQIHHNAVIDQTLICPYRRKKEWRFQSLRFHPDRQAECSLKALWKFGADQIRVKWSSLSLGSYLWQNNERLENDLCPAEQVSCIVSCKKWLGLIHHISNAY